MFADIFSGLQPSPLLRRFEKLLEPKSDAELEAMAQQAHHVTLAHFGKAMRLFAPIYLSNECINSCQYCGFSRENSILRVTLEVEEMRKEARHLLDEGFRSILLVAGEHPKYVSTDYLERCIRALTPEVPAVSVEVAPMSTEDYVPLVQAGAEGLVVYQETYHQPTYAELHPAGPKKDFAWRLNTPERAYAAGFRRIGIGALYGLWNWREEALACASHLEHLFKHCWKAQLTISFPRLRPAAGGFQPKFALPDREFVQLVCAVRICFPQAGIVLSTRESAVLRNSLIPLGITLMSAGSHTEPGGYTGQGKQALHQTVKGRAMAPDHIAADAVAAEQFEISDPRSAAEVAAYLRTIGYEPVWKDWDKGILSA
ncbi:MAG: 2-iminoacetate synthase ThiH [Verrucomicrobiota bacterium]